MLRAQLLTAGFFVEGLREVETHSKNLLEIWDQGHLELVDALVSYAPFTVNLCQAAALANDGNYPGVFDYEVSQPFGRWFGDYILLHGEEPPKAQAQEWLSAAVAAFFSIHPEEFAPEVTLRDWWTTQGVPLAKQNHLLRSLAAKAAPGAMVGPFRIGG